MADLACWAGPAETFRDCPPQTRITNAALGTARGDRQVCEKDLRHRALLSEGPQAASCPPLHPQCAPGLRPSAQPGSEAPAAQVCAVNGLGGTFLPPWEHRAHQRRRVPWAAAPPLGRDTLCGRESSHGNWTQGPARSAATLAVSYRPSSVSHPGVSCLLPAPATPAGRPARSPAGRGDPRATQHLSAAQACRTLLLVPDAPGPSRGHPRPHEGCRGTWPGQQGPCVSRVPAALHTETTHRDLPGKARCCTATVSRRGPGHVTWPPASTVAQTVSSPTPGQPALTCRHTATHGALPGPRLCLHLATS